MNPSSPCRIDVRESGLRPWRELVPLGDGVGARDAFEAALRWLTPDTDARLVVHGRVKAERLAVQFDGLGCS
jgi:hypothetical protein